MFGFFFILTDDKRFLGRYLDEYIPRVELASLSDFMDDLFFGNIIWVAAVLCDLLSLPVKYFVNQFTALFDFPLAVVSAEVTQMPLTNSIVLVR